MKAHARWCLLAFAPFLAAFDPMHIANRAIEEGNARMQQGKPDEALKLYDKALAERPTDPGIHFDRGAALYALKKFDDATQAFLRATEAKTPTLKEAAFYNLGNGFFQAQKFGEAIEAYKRALELDPNDQRAKWNLELALRKKKDEDEKKKNQKNDDKNKDDKNKDKQNKDDKKDDSKKDDPKKNDDKQDKNKDDKPKPDEPKPDPKQDQKKDQKQDDAPKPPQNQAGADDNKPPPDPKAPDMKEIESTLDSLERSPQSLEKERARMRALRRRPPVKDW